MSGTTQTVYWRFKGDRAWREAWMERIGNGLVKIKLLEWWDKGAVYSEDEIEIRSAPGAQERKIA